MAKKQYNRSGAQRANGTANRSGARPAGGSNGAARGATATATRPAVKASSSNGTATNSVARNATAQKAQTGQTSADRVALARQRNEANRLAAQRRRALEDNWFRQHWPTVATVVTVVLLIAVFFTIAHNASSGSASIGNPVPDSVLSKLSVSPSVFSAVGTGNITTSPLGQTKDSPHAAILKDSSGKPIFLYVGGEYCPFCAAERWSMVVALNRFGSFKNLTLMQSSSTDSYPNTSTVSFYGASYTSQYLTFQGVEGQDRNGNSLQKLTDQQQTLFTKYDAPPYIDSSNAGSIPFLDIGNQYIQISAGFIPDQLSGMTWQQIADKLSDPKSDITKNIIANANYITAAICQVTDNKPAEVCTAAPIPTIITAMKAGK